jgi:sialic acid synthase SpsE
MSTKLIAELSMNFMGDMELAEEMVAAAATAGADYIKFQTWKIDGLIEGPWDKDGRREIYEKAELSEADHEHLKDICEANGAKFLTSVFSPDLLPMVSGLSDSVKMQAPSVAIKN